MKKRTLIIIQLIIFAFIISGCRSPLEKISVGQEGTVVEFETMYQGYVIFDNSNPKMRHYGYSYPENTFLNSKEDLERFVENTGIVFDYDKVDFSEYMLFVIANTRFSTCDIVGMIDVKRISYNEKTLDVLFDGNSCINTDISPDENHYVVEYNIVKIKKSVFPYESRDYLEHTTH